MKTTIKLMLVFAVAITIATLLISCSKESTDVKPQTDSITKPTFVLTTQMLLGNWKWYGDKLRNFEPTVLTDQDASDNWYKYNYSIDKSNNIIRLKTHQKLKNEQDYTVLSQKYYDTIPNCFISGDTLYSQWVSFSTGKIIKKYEGRRK